MTKLEAKLDVNKERFDNYDSKIKKRFKENCLLPEKGDFPNIYEWEETFYDDQEYLDKFMKVYNNPEVKEEESTPDSFDHHLGMESDGLRK